jgi:ABC-2 type transport system permease protein
MNQFGTLLQKEWREITRNFKIIWLPIVFILFGISEPLTNYFLPQILDSVGNLPEGAVIEMPVPPAEQVLIAIMGQYQFIGMLVLVLAFMGSIAGERSNGNATLLYVRPLSYPAYYLSKWLMASIVALISLWSGLMAGYYYTTLLFSTVDFVDFLQFSITYSIWILMVVSVALTASAMMPNAGLAAALSFGVIFLVQIVDGLVGMYWAVSPVKIPAYAAEWLTGTPNLTNFWWAIVLGIIAILLLIVLGIWASRKNAGNVRV